MISMRAKIRKALEIREPRRVSQDNIVRIDGIVWEPRSGLSGGQNGHRRGSHAHPGVPSSSFLEGLLPCTARHGPQCAAKAARASRAPEPSKQPDGGGLHPINAPRPGLQDQERRRPMIAANYVTFFWIPARSLRQGAWGPDPGSLPRNRRSSTVCPAMPQNQGVLPRDRRSRARQDLHPSRGAPPTSPPAWTLLTATMRRFGNDFILPPDLAGPSGSAPSATKPPACSTRSARSVQDLGKERV
jgi:hypothetical protein